VSRAAPPTADELTAAFEDLLNDPTGGLDGDTVAAIERVWAAGANPPAALVSAARHELEMQLDDTHVREAQDRDDAISNEVAARQDTTQT
jgi:hypothetical protein